MSDNDKKETPQLYLGIDLGTTNCSICYGRERKDGKFEVNVLELDLETDDNEYELRTLLPSFVFFPDDGSEPKIGPIAKKMLESKPHKVIRSVKSLIGRPLNDEQKMMLFQNGKQYKAYEISAMYLKTLLNNVKEQFGVEIKDAVITIPASFDSDMRKATIEAARLAGIKTTDENDKPRNLLLDEPRASLFDFVNQLDLGQAPIDYTIDFTTTKKVLIFDLGGGTLDVSCHEVKREENSKFIDIKDIAISRYTNLGGDTFDQRIAEYLFQDYITSKKLDPNDYTEHEILLVRTKLLLAAEEIKKKLTGKYKKRKDFSGEDSIKLEDVQDKIMPGYLIAGKSYGKKLSLKEYAEIIDDLFAWDIEYPTPETVEDIPKMENKFNLIYPILDVIYKAKEKWNLEKPDLILLAGGMTRFPLIKMRLEKFFGKIPITLLDPDKSVSRGASVFHYYLHNGYKPSTITAESILFEDKSGLKEIIPAGIPITELQPYHKVYTDKWQISSDTKTRYRISFYRSDKYNKIFSRSIKLSKPYPRGTKVGVEVIVDIQKIMTFKVWIIGENGERLEEQTMEVDTESSTIPPKDLQKDINDKDRVKLALPDPIIVRSRILEICKHEGKSVIEILETMNAKKDTNFEKVIRQQVDSLIRELQLHKVILGGTPYYQANEHIKNSLPNGEMETISENNEEQEETAIRLSDITKNFEKFIENGTLEYGEINKKTILKSPELKEIIQFLLDRLRKNGKVPKPKKIRPRLKNQIYHLFGNAALKKEIRENRALMQRMQRELTSFIRFIVDRFEKDYSMSRSTINNGLSFAIIALGRVGLIDPEEEVLRQLLRIIDNDNLDSVWNHVFIALGKLPPHPDIVARLDDIFIQCLNKKGLLTTILWAIGKQAIRDSEDYLPIAHFQGILRQMLRTYSNIHDLQEIQYYTYAFMELGSFNPYSDREQINDTQRTQIIQAIEEMSATAQEIYENGSRDFKIKQKNTINYLERLFTMSIKRLRGEELTEEEEEMLLESRINE